MSIPNEIEEPPLDPERPIIDPHLHLWDVRPEHGAMLAAQQFLLREVLETIGRSGHNITHSVFVQCYAMYRRDGPPELRSLGETEFANGVAAMSASGNYGPCSVAHRIVANVDLRLGACAAPVLEAHKAAAGERFSGVRCAIAYSEAGMFGAPCDPRLRHVMLDPQFREGARALARMGLSLDVWCFHTQLDEVIAFADALPELTIILDHVGSPETLGRYAGGEAAARAEWEKSIRELARRPNVLVKLGGIGMDFSRPIGGASRSQPSEILAEGQRPYIEFCIDAFTPRRAMFESNFPPDNAAGSYGATWNAFKIIARGYSEDEKDLLFRRTAAGAYGISLDRKQED